MSGPWFRPSHKSIPEIIIVFCVWLGSVAQGVWTKLTWLCSAGQPILILSCRFTLNDVVECLSLLASYLTRFYFPPASLMQTTSSCPMLMCKEAGRESVFIICMTIPWIVFCGPEFLLTLCFSSSSFWKTACCLQFLITIHPMKHCFTIKRN